MLPQNNFSTTCRISSLGDEPLRHGHLQSLGTLAIQSSTMQAHAGFSNLTDKVVIPAFFTLLGALLSLAATEWKEYRQRKKAKKAFLRAIAMDLDAVAEQLGATLTEINASQELPLTNTPCGALALFHENRDEVGRFE